MRKLFLALLLGAVPLCAQIPAPQIPITGIPGAGGNFPFLNSGAFAIPTDADYTPTYPNTSCIICKVTSLFSLTATRNLIEPAVTMTFNITNATSGGQSIVVKAASGTGVTIANGTSKWVWFDGTNYVEIDPPAGTVSSVFSRTGAVTAQSGDYTVSQVTGAAPIASPTFTGVVTAPTATFNSSSVPLELGPASTYASMSLEAAAPSTGTMTPFITFSRGSPDGVTYGGPGSLGVLSAAGIGGNIGDGAHPGLLQWDGTGHLFVSNLGSETTGNSDLNGELTLASGVASYTFSFTNGGGHPICVANDTTALNPVQPTYATGGSVWVVTFHGTGTDVVDYICTGKGVY